MRLINTTSYFLEEFFGDNIPNYAILSHTWGAEEVSYQEWIYAHNQGIARWGWVRVEEEVDRIKAKSGYKKILNACQQARSASHQWIWVDTNCIDKSSSSEMSEAINSMFNWYQKAKVCYAYLADVPSMNEQVATSRQSAFRSSRWFTRGWTLQELIAPAYLDFYSLDWNFIPSRESLAQCVKSVTGIPTSCLGSNPFQSRRHSIAAKLSWASKRRTTRIEDSAYCLLGILNVQMTLFYGEGENAFLRLQGEIIKRDADQSLLAWDVELPYILSENVPPLFTYEDASNDSLGVACTGLARSPAAFVRSSDVFDDMVWSRPTMEIPEPHSITSLGLCGSFSLVETISRHFMFAILMCVDSEDNDIWIPLRRYTARAHHYTRLLFPKSMVKVRRELLRLGRQHTGSNVDEVAFNISKIFIDISEQSGNGQDIFLGYNNEFNKFPRLNTNISAGKVGVVVTFPCGKHSYNLASSYPSRTQRLAFDLHIEKDVGGVAHGILRFCQDKGEMSPDLGLLFAVQLDEKGHAQRWTCRILHINEIGREELKTRSTSETAQIKDWRKSDHVDGHFVFLGDECYEGEQDMSNSICTKYQCVVAHVFFSNLEHDTNP
jgi:hypothetical protein